MAIIAQRKTSPTLSETFCHADFTGKIELIDDKIIFNDEFKKNIAIPYF